MSQQDWSSVERWVWNQICVGQIANFHTQLGPLDPKNSDGWKVNRQLGAGFLRKIFYDKNVLEKLPPEGVRIIGAWFPDGLLFSDGRLPGSIWLEKCRFEKPIVLFNQVVDGSLSLAKSFVAAPPEGVSAIDLTGTKIDGWLNLAGATVGGKLMMNALHVGQRLAMAGSTEAPATSQNSQMEGRSRWQRRDGSTLAMKSHFTASCGCSRLAALVR